MSARTLLAFVVSFLALSTFTSHAAADKRALVLEPSGDASAHEKELAADAVEQGLVASGYTIIDRAWAAESLKDPSFAQCQNSACATAALPALNVQMAVSVAAWSPSKLRDRGKISVILSDPTGHEVSEDVALERAMPVTEASNRALAGALSKWPPLGTVPVEVNTDPIGAVATLDRTPLGQTPVTAQIAPGKHTLTLALRSYITEHEAIEISNTPEHTQRFAYTLSTATPEDGSSLLTPHEDVGSAWNFILGGTLVAGGLVLGALPVSTLATNGDPVNGGRDQVHFGALSGIELGGAVLLTAAGLYFLIAQPIND